MNSSFEMRFLGDLSFKLFLTGLFNVHAQRTMALSLIIHKHKLQTLVEVNLFDTFFYKIDKIFLYTFGHNMLLSIFSVAWGNIGLTKQPSSDYFQCR